MSQKQNDANWVTRLTLLAKVKDKNDQSAWSDFVFYYRKYIYNIVRRMGLSHHDAEEAVQMVLLKAWDKLPSFDYAPEKGRFRGWLCKVAGNTVKNIIRSKSAPHVSIDAMDGVDGDSPELGATRPEIEEFAEREWERYLPELAWKTVAKTFEPQVMDAFKLFAAGKSADEIAQKLGISESSVYVYKKRVQDKLSAEIARLKKEL